MEKVQILNPFWMQTAFTISTNWNKNGAHGCAVMWFKLFYFCVNRHCPQLKKRYNQVWVILQIFLLLQLFFSLFLRTKSSLSAGPLKFGRLEQKWSSQHKPSPLLKSSFKSQICQKQQCCLQCGKVSCTKVNYSLHDD